MTMPGFDAEKALRPRTGHYRSSASVIAGGGIAPQSRLTCAFKAGRLAGRCLALGHEHSLCMETAADFNTFCNEHDL